MSGDEDRTDIFLCETDLVVIAKSIINLGTMSPRISKPKLKHEELDDIFKFKDVLRSLVNGSMSRKSVM